MDDLGWEDMLRVYIAGDKKIFKDALDAAKLAVQAMEATLEAGDQGLDKALENAAAALVPAIHTSRMFAVGLEENRRMLLKLRQGLG